jgi:HD-GYP domain-containing protein (c-di-GMP phosphodiesterase class II)
MLWSGSVTRPPVTASSGERVGREFRLAELLAALSLATDLANAMPPEHSLRNTLLAVSLGRHLGLDGQQLSDAYYAAMLRFISCTASAHEEAAFNAGDDISFRKLFAGVDFVDSEAIGARAMTGMGGRLEEAARQKLVADFFAAAPEYIPVLTVTNCEAGARLAKRLGMSPGVVTALAQFVERWDGQGGPQGLQGEEICMPARIMDFAFVMGMEHHRSGRPAAVETARQRRGSQFDPQIVDAFVDNADGLMASLGSDSVWDETLAAEPEPRPWMPSGRLSQLAQGFAEFTDLKTPFTVGHSGGVARLSEAAGRAAGLGGDDVVCLRQAALLHDLGRVSVPNGIWEKPGPLSDPEWERVRLHPYYTERILKRVPAFQPLAALAGMHCERLDGSGYHRGLPATMVPVPARVLAAADAYQAMGEERPHRPPAAAAAAAAELRAESRAGRLDRDAVDAVLEAAGHRRERRRGGWPSGLSDREVDVFRLLATGHSNRETGERLHISEQTVHGHVRTIYGKIGVSTRASAALFAMEHDLIQPV